jgi:hypothetical protein
MKVKFLTAAATLSLGVVASANAGAKEDGGIAAAPLCTVADGQCNQMIPQVPGLGIREPITSAPPVTAPAQNRRFLLLY